MNFALLWIDALIVWLLWVAFFAACIARLGRKWLRIVLLVIVFLVALLPLAAFLTTASDLKFWANVEPNWFAYALSLLVGYVVGAGIIFRQARRPRAGLMPAAANWRRIPLGLALLIVAGVGYMALLNMDVATRARCAILRVNVGMQYWAAALAIVSESQNAAPIYEEVIRRMPYQSIEHIYNPPFGDNKTFDPNEPGTVTFLTQQAETLAMLRRAASLPGCRFESDLNDPVWAGLLPDLNLVRYAAMALDLDARMQMMHGHVDLAVDDTSAVFGMARHIGQRPSELCGMIGMGINSMAVNMLERILPAVRNQDELNRLHLDRLMPLDRMFLQSLRGEEQYGLSLYGTMPYGTTDSMSINNLANLTTTRLEIPSDPGSLYLRVFFLDLNDYVQLMQECQADALNPYYKIHDRLPNVKSRHWGMLTRVLAPSLSTIFVVAARIEAKDTCAQLAVEMTRYRLDHGSLPANLADLVPNYLDAIPTDPFDGKSLRLVIRNNEWIIYSVGPDGIDDGGIDYYGEMQKGKGDIVFKLKATPASPTTTP